MVKMGYQAEYDRKKDLEKLGYVVFRVSGSIGAMDLIVIKPKGIKGFDVWLEQIKSTRKKIFYFDERSRDEWNRLLEMKKRGIRSYFSVKFRRGTGKKSIWKIIEVTEDRPKKITV